MQVLMLRKSTIWQDYFKAQQYHLTPLLNHLHQQLGNLTIPAGTVLFTNNCQMLYIVQFYSCFWSTMIPVFSSFAESWAWVVSKSFNVNQPWVR